MARKPSMTDALETLGRGSDRLSAPAAPIQPRGRTAARVGKKGIAFWVDPAAAKQLAFITAEEDRTVQSLMEEALDLLFQSRGKHRLATANGKHAA